MTTRRPGCKARQVSDQMHCARCGLTWDAGDPNPPDCLDQQEVKRQRGRNVFRKLREMLTR